MKRTTVFLTSDQDQQLKLIAEMRGGQKVAELIRRAIDDLIAKLLTVKEKE